MFLGLTEGQMAAPPQVQHTCSCSLAAVAHLHPSYLIAKGARLSALIGKGGVAQRLSSGVCLTCQCLLASVNAW
jgi:hypothetical protein